MKSPYRISARPEAKQEEAHAKPLAPAVPICIALGLLVEIVGAATHSLDSFGHLMVGFAFVLATAGLQAGAPRA